MTLGLEIHFKVAYANYNLYSMVNNAGIFCGLNKIENESTDAFDKTMVRSESTLTSRRGLSKNIYKWQLIFLMQLVNSRGVFLGMKYAVIQMMKQKPLPTGERGWIVNVASIGGLVGLAQERKF